MSEQEEKKSGCPYAAAAAAGAKPTNTDEEPLTYHNYLQIDRILSSQFPQTQLQTGTTAHDEMLFIVIHQAYELWFKQILWELDSVRTMFSQETLSHQDLAISVSRLKRIGEIQKVLIDQLRILETMTSFSFLDFRGALGTSSGFQSFQFREIEVKLGLKREKRMTYNKKPFCMALNEEQRAAIAELEKDKSLFDLLEEWLARFPCFKHEGFDFWEEYKTAIKQKFEEERKELREANKEGAGGELDAEALEAAIKNVDADEGGFDEFFKEEEYQKLLGAGKKRLSHVAARAAIMINVYQEEALFALPFQLLQSVIEIDENMRTWRYRHALMVHRMLGMKLGTGGSSGFHYLQATATNHMVFKDLFDLNMFLIPRSLVPPLPESFRRHFGYRFEYN